MQVGIVYHTGFTVSDIERYGPGVVVDYGSAGEFRMLMWVE